jgi:hypothetical protein
LQNTEHKQHDKPQIERSLTGLQGRMKHSCDHAENQSGDA